MKISLEKLEAGAESTGFRPDVLERVAHLLALLGTLDSHPFLRGKLALKGGTALNLFLFDVPRLSVDIDLNYVGSESRDGMLEERPQIEEAMRAVFGREDFEVGEAPREHAGGKWHLRYAASIGQRSGIDVDLNYMLRVPLWPITRMDSHSWQGGRRRGYPWWIFMNWRRENWLRCWSAAKPGTCLTAVWYFPSTDWTYSDSELPLLYMVRLTGKIGVPSQRRT